MANFIDIHNHLIPQFDDGPRTMDESLRMLKQAEDQGITDVFATSHFTEIISEEVEKTYFRKLESLREEAIRRGIRVNLYSGSEIFFHQQVESTVVSSKVGTLGGYGQYILLEFPMFQMPNGIEEVLFNLSANNYIPIVAHPARYKTLLSQPNRILNFVHYGGLLQLNGGSILGYFGKETQKLALSFLEKRIVHFIASDAHSPDGRSFVLSDVYEFLKDKLPSGYLNEIFYKNPRCIIDRIRIDKVTLPEVTESGGFFKRLRFRFK
jgi:protein-tyrosine phosphatase